MSADQASRRRFPWRRLLTALALLVTAWATFAGLALDRLGDPGDVDGVA